jgi:2-polyprenyl-6-methoxyphenol hydroxylase-like FAD-dependent oxidoreductase
MKIVINGAGIAGPTLAYWLQHEGHDVLLVEEAPEIRRGGYIIDFWGVGYDVAENMGLLPRIRALGYPIREVQFVDDRGRTTGGFSTDVFGRMTGGRFTSLRRSDLSVALHHALGGLVEMVFGDSIAAIEEQRNGVRVRFTRSGPRDVDLVIGADGLHSRVRRIVFGREASFEVALGYHVAAFEVDGYRPRTELTYVSHAVPGRQVSRFAMREDKTLFLLVFRDEYLAHAASRGPDPKAVLTAVFGDVGWECPQILRAMQIVREIYFDRVSQIRMARWTNGRTALVGDAAACVSLLAGEGTGLAMAEAYVLAEALRDCSGNHDAAFASYEASLMPFLSRKQEAAARFASSFVPKTAVGIGVRNIVTRLLRVPVIADVVIGRDLRDDLDLFALPAHASRTSDNGGVTTTDR